MNCLRCGYDRYIHARGLCANCYNSLRRKKTLLIEFPMHNRKSRTIPERGDPHIRWLLQEIEAQRRRDYEVTGRAGVDKKLLTRIRAGLFEMRFSTFKSLAGALGYEIQMVGKEPDATGP